MTCLKVPGVLQRLGKRLPQQQHVRVYFPLDK